MRIQRSNKPLIQPRLCWERPMVGWLKCNVDAGFYLKENTTTAASLQQHPHYNSSCFRDNEASLLLHKHRGSLLNSLLLKDIVWLFSEAIKLTARAGNKWIRTHLSSTWLNRNRFSSKFSSNSMRTFS
jgi:hypothetical protein